VLLPWANELPTRLLSDITLIVVHATEEPTLASSRKLAEQSENQISAHYYIDRDGDVQRWVPDDRIANHVLSHNPKSIGIELVNNGRYPTHFSSTSQQPSEPFPKVQLQALMELLRLLSEVYPSGVQLVRHSDLDLRLRDATDNKFVAVRRRIDPGPLFPWDRLVDFWCSINAQKAAPQ